MANGGTTRSGGMPTFALVSSAKSNRLNCTHITNTDKPRQQYTSSNMTWTHNTLTSGQGRTCRGIWNTGTAIQSDMIRL
jgi:hypothetical protein